MIISRTNIQLGLFLLILFSDLGLAHQSAESSLKLNAAEQAFLSKTNFLSLCSDPDWLPYEAINSKGQHEGIMADFHDMWSKRIGVEIRLVKTTSWKQSLDYIKQRKCDLLSSAQDIPERRSYLSVTQSIINYPFAIATQKDNQFIVNLRQVLNKDFAMVKGYAAIDMLRSKYPTITIKSVDSVKVGLKMVERGEVYAFIDTVPTIYYQSQAYGVSHINISGVLDLHYDISVGVRSDQHDQLTGIANRYLLDSTFHAEKTRAERYSLAFSIIIIDIDLFKSINDNYGHNLGDSVLTNIAALLTREIRENDIVGRWGGEEFLIICPETPKDGAQQLAEHIREKVNTYDFNIDQPLTVSLGVTEFRLKEPMNICIKRADDALYSAKEKGRDRVVSH